VRGGELGNFRRARGDSASCTHRESSSRAPRGFKRVANSSPGSRSREIWSASVCLRTRTASGFSRRDAPLELDSDRLLLRILSLLPPSTPSTTTLAATLASANATSTVGDRWGCESIVVGSYRFREKNNFAGPRAFRPAPPSSLPRSRTVINHTHAARS